MLSFSKKTHHFFAAAFCALLGLLASPASAGFVFVTNTNDSGAGSLRQAILDANSSPGNDTIFFSGIDGGTITLLSDLPALTDLADFSMSISTSLTITGGNFALDQSLPIGAAGIVAYDGAFSSTGSLSVISNYRFLLNGISSSYAGGMTVFDGELIIGDAAHASAVFGDGTNTTTLSGGTLSGHGTVNMNVTNTSGTVSPGSSGTIGPLAVGGNYVQGSGGTLAITISPAAASTLAVTGTAALDGNLVVTFNAGTYTAKTFTLLSASAISGTFSNVTLTPPTGVTISALQYNPTSVTFDVVTTATQTDVFSTFAFPTIGAAHQAGDTLFDQLNGANNNTQNSPVSFASFTNKGITQEENLGGLNHLAKNLSNTIKHYGGWFKATGNLASVESSATATGYDSETGGFMFGADREAAEGVRVGAAGGYEHTSLTATNSANTGGESNTVRFALYGSKAFEDNVSLQARLGYALHMIDTERLETNNGLIGRSSHDGHEFSSGLQLSKTINLHSYMVTPKAGLSYVLLAEDGYTETGAGLFNATIADKDTHSLRLSTGLNIAREARIQEWQFVPEARVKYSYETLDAISTTSGTVLGTAFSSKGVEPSRHMLAIGFGASAKLNDTVDAFGSYDVNLPTGNAFEQTFAAGVKFRF